jgi:hypothetical protein
MDLVEKLYVLDGVLAWSRVRRSSFPIWELEEIVSEGYIQAMVLHPKWDRAKGSLSSFLHSYLYDPVFRSYAKQHGIVVRREKVNGKLGKRTYKTKVHYRGDMGEVLDTDLIEYAPIHGSIEVPWSSIGSAPRAVAYLLARGLNKKQTGKSLGLSGGRISQLANEVRNIMKERKSER